jgi:hypothetical protein
LRDSDRRIRQDRRDLEIFSQNTEREEIHWQMGGLYDIFASPTDNPAFFLISLTIT